MPIISLPSKAHTAFDKKKLKDFHSWISCKKDKYVKNAKELSCFFPKNLGDHRDAITVYCEEQEVIPIWEKQWMKRYGGLEFSEYPPGAFKVYPAYTVLMYTSHDINRELDILEIVTTGEPRILYSDSNSPWAKECKRIFNKPKNNNQYSESIKNKEIKKNDDAHQKCLKAADYKGCMNYQSK